MMYAVDSGYFEMCRLLATCETGLKTTGGDTSLMIAAFKGNVNIVRLLAEAEAGERGHQQRSVGAGYTALQLAIFFGHLECVKILYDYEKDVKDDQGRTCIDYARLATSRSRKEGRAAVRAYLEERMSEKL